ncbi:MAG: hypothetical protein ACREQM_23625 [Candidatus Dormibacteraceae bacterium]
MSTAAEHPQTLRLLGAGFRIYRRHWALMTMIAAATFVPVNVIEAGLEHLLTTEVTPSESVLHLAVKASEVLGALVSIVLVLLVEVLYAALVEDLAGSELLGHPLRRPLDILHDLPWWSVLATTLLTTLLAVAGYVLVVIPGLIVVTLCAIAVPVARIERRGPLSAIWRSIRLSRRRLRLPIVLALVPTLILFAIEGGLEPLQEHQAVLAFLVSDVVLAVTLEPFCSLLVAVLAHTLVARYGGAGEHCAALAEVHR